MDEKRAKRRFFSRDSVVASLGVSAGVIILSVVGASWWWMGQSRRADLRAERARDLDLAAALTAPSVESMLGAGELTAARSVVAEVGRRAELASCSVILPDGRVIADAEPSRITAIDLPSAWPTGSVASSEVESAGMVRRETDLLIPGRGRATLRMEARVEYPVWANWESQAGAGAIGVVGIGAFFGVYRRMRTRMGAMGAIAEALGCYSDGERSASVLEVSEGFGDQAKAWNTILREYEAVKRQLSAERSGQGSGAPKRRDENLSWACDAMSHGVIVVDERQRVRYANGAAAIFLGAQRDTMLSQDIRKFLTERGVLEALEAVAKKSLRARAVIESELTGEGKSVLRYTVRSMRRSDGEMALVTVEDVTQQRLADVSRNAFVAQATHELRTPLTNIRLYVEDLVDSADKDPARRARSLNVINEEVRRLERIVGDMLSVSELEAGQLKLAGDDVRLDAMFEQLEAEYRIQSAEKRVRLEMKLPPKMPVIRGDRDKLTMAVGNLIGNALKYTPSGGDVTVTVRSDADMVTVEVTDTGIGISEDEQELVFEKFYRSKDARLEGITGSGLGLALARQIARLHGGDITVSSVLNKGSTFTLTAPAAAPVSLAA